MADNLSGGGKSQREKRAKQQVCWVERLEKGKRREHIFERSALSFGPQHHEHGRGISKSSGSENEQF